jgi:hypothetical protein
MPAKSAMDHPSSPWTINAKLSTYAPFLILLLSVASLALRTIMDALKAFRDPCAKVFRERGTVQAGRYGEPATIRVSMEKPHAGSNR